MDLDALHAFIAVAEHGSYLAAAQRVAVSRSTLRRRVAALEARVGVPVLETTRDGVALTEAGRVLLEQGRRVSAEVTGLVEAARSAGREPGGELRMVVPPGLPPRFTVAWLRTLMQAFPGVRCTFIESLRPLTEAWRDVDVMLLLSQGVPRCPANWRTARLLTVRQRLWADPDYLARRGTPTDVLQLADHPLLLWSGPDEGPPGLPLCGGGRAPCTPTLYGPDIHAMLACAAEGVGIACVPRAEEIEPESLWPQLVPILEEQVGCSYGVWFATAETRARSPKVGRAIEQLRGMVDQFSRRR